MAQKYALGTSLLIDLLGLGFLQENQHHNALESMLIEYITARELVCDFEHHQMLSRKL